MKNILIYFTLLLTACGSDYDPYKLEPKYTPPDTVEPKVDEQVAEYVYAFKAECESRNVQLCLARWGRLEYVKVVSAETLRPADQPDAQNRVGVCYSWEDNKGRLAKAQVQILEGDWDPAVLRGLVYHELGHCLLDKSHTCEIGEAGCADKKFKPHPHMMYPYIYDAQTYVDFWDQMLEELFQALGLWLTGDDEPQGPLTKHTVE